MLFLLMAAYLLLCVRFEVCVEASLINARGRAAISIGLLGFHLRQESVLVRKKGAIGLTLEPVHGRKTDGKKHPAHPLVHRAALEYLRDVAYRRGFARLSLHMRLGLGDACATAVAVGAARALISGVFTAIARPQACDLRVTPDFSCAGVQAYAQGIFFCQAGDIMLAALKTAQRKRREGFKWTSIPLRA